MRPPIRLVETDDRPALKLVGEDDTPLNLRDTESFDIPEATPEELSNLKEPINITAERSTTDVGKPLMQDVVEINPVKAAHSQKQIDLLIPKIQEIMEKGVMGNPDYFKDEKNRERFFNNLSSRYTEEEISQLKGEKRIPALDKFTEERQAEMEQGDGYMQQRKPLTPLGESEGFARIMSSPADAFTHGIIGGWDKLKETGNVYDKEGDIAATGNAVAAVTHMVMGGLNLLPAMAAFTVSATVAGEIAPETTEAILAPITAITDPQTEGGKSWAQIGDFLAFAGVLWGAVKGKAVLKGKGAEAGKAGAEGIAEGLKDFSKLPIEEQKTKIEDYAQEIVKENKFESNLTPTEKQVFTFSKQAQDLMKEIENAPDELKPIYEAKLAEVDGKHTEAANEAATQNIADAANKTVSDNLQEAKTILEKHVPTTETGKALKEEHLSKLNEAINELNPKKESNEKISEEKSTEKTEVLSENEILTENVPEETKVTEAVSSEPLNEAKKIATENEFKHPEHLLNAVAKATGEKPATVQETTLGALEKVKQQRDQLTKKVIDKKSEESISPEPLKSETDATKEISKQESVSPKPESGDQSRKETKPSSSDSVLGEKKSTGESEKALTDLESAKQKRKEAKASLDAHRKNLGISFDSKERAKRLYEYHSALVAEAKEYIKKGINDVKEFAKEIDEKLSDAVKRAWDEATGKQKFEQKYFESVKDASDNFNDLVTKNIESDVVKETLSNVERETGRELTKEEKEYKEKALRTALSHGEEVVTQAKVEFGDNYVTDLLEYLDENKNKLSTDQKSLIQIALELDLERQIKEKPDLTIEKQLKLVRDKSIAEQRSAAQAIGYGRLRQIARVGYDVNKVTDQFFSSEQLEGKQKVEKAIQSSAKEIQKEAERKETEQGKVDIAEKEKRKQKRKQKRAERIKKADAQISEAASEIAQAFGWETNIIGDKRPNAVKSLVKLGDGLIKKGEATVENVYEKIKEHLKDKFGKDLPDTYKKEVENSLKTTKTAAEKNIARLEKELENVQQGKIKIRDVREKTAREKELRDQINDAKEELGLIESKPLGKEVAQTVKQHLIDEGFGKELKDGKKVLDWIKLAGEEGSVDKMKQIVSNSLEKEGYTKEQITEIQKSLENEYHDLRASIIEKSLNELESRNKVSQTETKSSARKLAELYNLGLFEKEATTYDNILNKALGLSDIGQKHFAEAKKLAESLSELYSTQNKGKTVNELGIAHATRVINAEIETLLSKIAWEQSNGAFKAAVIAKEYMGLAQRNMLVSLKQGIENPLSGFIQRAFTALGFSFDKVDSKVLRQNRSKLAKVIYDDAVRNGGLIYGDITTPFISHTHTINWLNKKSDSQIYHTAVSGMIGRAFLEGADSMHKTALVERYFTYNLIKILTDSKNPNRMGKQEAVNFVSEQLTGQSLTDARVTAKEIITRVNTKAGKEVLADNKQTIERLANDIIKDSLIKGEKLTTKEIEASYKSAYDAAGFDLGHESNNLISMGVGKGTAYVEHQIKTAVKEKRWSEAAAWTFSSILTKNILNPFVGGGTNWVVLTLQKSGIDFVSPLWDYARKKSNPLDVTTEAGIKNMEKALQKNLRSKNTSTRFIVGAMASIITYSAARASGADEDINAWIKKNEWSRKFFNVVAPQSLVFLLYQKNKELGKYFGSLLNIKTDNFDDAKRLQSAIDKISKGKKEEGWQKGGELVGGKTSMPLIPYRIATQVQDVVRGVQGKSPIKFDFESKGFVEGYYDQGIVNYVARLIDPQPYKNAKSKFTGSTTDPEELKLTPEEKRQMKEDAEEAKKLLREEKNYVE